VVKDIFPTIPDILAIFIVGGIGVILAVPALTPVRYFLIFCVILELVKLAVVCGHIKNS